MLTFQKAWPERMKLLSSIVFTLILGTWATPTFGVAKPETSHLEFVTEYIRELAATENLRASAEQELKQGSKDEAFSNGIHGSTLLQLELRSQVAMLRGMNLKPPFDDLIPNIRVLYSREIALHQKLINIASAILAGPKPNVDYGKLVAEMPKIRAELEFVDRTLFDVTPLIFATLIDQKPDSKNHVSHLIITKTERTKLIDDLNVGFGSKLDEKNPNFRVGAASVLRTFFLKDFKCADEPWE
ncbi:MAG: hypothetical protein JWO20_1735 [Candidatus Angelobacter sp.]|nr:hypothetical protein [Candidatus Angelobacter sp.]